MSHIRHPPPGLREAETLDELREIVREMWTRVIALEDELAGRRLDDLDSAARRLGRR